MDAMEFSGIFQKNLERWSLICKLGKERVASLECFHINFCYSSSGALNLVEKINDQEAFYLHDQDDPLKEARDWFDKLILKNVQILYVYGVGLGYYYEAAKDWLHEQSNRALIFLEDNPEVIYRFLEIEQASFLLFDRQTALYLFDEKDPQSYRLDRIVLLYSTSCLKECVVSALQSYQQRRKTQCNEVESRVSFFHSLCKAAAAEYTNAKSPFIRNFFWNYLDLPKSHYANGLQDRFANIPAIICGAGPSLDKNIEILATLTDRALIFAGGTALNALNAKNIMPHFGVGIDPNPAHFTRLVMNHAYELPFFYRTRMLHEALEMVHGDKLYVTGNAGYPIGNWMEDRLNIDHSLDISEGFNVLNLSLGIAYALKCNPIICVGIDLAYSDNRSYASGLISHPVHDQKANFKTKAFEDDVICRNDIFGNPIFTLWKWIAESLWYTNFAKKNPDLILINCTEGGIGFPYIPNLPLSLVKEGYLRKQYDFSTLIHGEIQNTPFPESMTTLKIKEVMRELMDSLKNCQSYSQNIVDFLLKQPDRERGEIAHLKETEEEKLHQESAFKAILQPFNEYFFKASDLERTRCNLEKEILSDREFECKITELDSAHYIALNQTSQTLQVLIERILKYYEDTEKIICRWKEESQGYLEALSKEYPIPDPNPNEMYHFDNKILTIIDEEMSLHYQQLFSPDPEKETNRMYYPNGALKAEWFYKNSLLHGPATFFGQEGKILARSWFLEGKKEGKMWTYYSDGQVHSLQRFHSGLGEGQQLFFYPGGLPKSSFHYSSGILNGEVVLFHSQGFMERKLRFENGKREGKEQIWDSRNVLRIEAFFRVDQPIETARIWHYNGVLAKEIVYDENSNRMSAKEWDEYGMQAQTQEIQEDYFVKVTKQAEKLTDVLDNMVNQVSHVVPLVSQARKRLKSDLSSELTQLQVEVERLQQLNQNLKDKISLDAISSESLWQSQKIQNKAEKQLETFAKHINEDIGILQAELKQLMTQIFPKNEEKHEQ